MVQLSSIITTVLLLPMCECATIRNSSKQAIIFAARNKSYAGPWKRTLLRWNSYQRDELTVVVNSFDLGITVLAVAVAVKEQNKFPQLDPTLAYYHTSAYRWMLRQLDLYPDLFYKKLFELHKVWRRRFYYEDVSVPRWLRNLLVWVDKPSWDKEDNMTRLYNIYARREFDKNDRYPPKKFVSTESFSNSTSIYYPGPFLDTLYDEGLPIAVPQQKNPGWG